MHWLIFSIFSDMQMTSTWHEDFVLSHDACLVILALDTQMHLQGIEER